MKTNSSVPGVFFTERDSRTITYDQRCRHSRTHSWIIHAASPADVKRSSSDRVPVGTSETEEEDFEFFIELTRESMLIPRVLEIDIRTAPEGICPFSSIRVTVLVET